jgi:hypothetical protein
MTEGEDYDSSECDHKITFHKKSEKEKKTANTDKNYIDLTNTTDFEDLKDLKDTKSRNFLEREREREKEKILEYYYPGSTGTVGCVCMLHGHVAAATSTGGLTNKMAGRVGKKRDFFIFYAFMFLLLNSFYILYISSFLNYFLYLS